MGLLCRCVCGGTGPLNGLISRVNCEDTRVFMSIYARENTKGARQTSTSTITGQ